MIINDDAPEYAYEIINDKMRPIAERLTAKYKEIGHVRPDRILFVLCRGKTGGKRIVLAKTFTISLKWQELLMQLGGEYAHMIEFYHKTTAMLSQNQMTALVYHELAHIGPEGDLVRHDTEDWWRMIAGMGRHCFYPDAGCPDLLAPDVDWKRLTGKGDDIRAAI